MTTSKTWGVIALAVAAGLIVWGIAAWRNAASPATGPANTLSAGNSTSTPPMALNFDEASLTPADRLAWKNFLGVPAACSYDDMYAIDFQSGGGPDLVFYPLAPGTVLTEVPCNAGAYEGTERYYLVTTSPQPAAAPLTFTAFVNDGTSVVETSTQELIGLPSFNATLKQLGLLDEARGTGDCGIYNVYSFTAGRPTLVSARSENCPANGLGPTNPLLWPTLK